MNVQAVESWSDLQDWIDRKLTGIESDLGDSETMQSLGMHGTARLQAVRAVLLDLAHVIRFAVQAEENDRAAAARENFEEAYREAYGDEPIAPWQAEGR